MFMSEYYLPEVAKAELQQYRFLEKCRQEIYQGQVKKQDDFWAMQRKDMRKKEMNSVPKAQPIQAVDLPVLALDLSQNKRSVSSLAFTPIMSMYESTASYAQQKFAKSLDLDNSISSRKKRMTSFKDLVQTSRSSTPTITIHLEDLNNTMSVTSRYMQGSTKRITPTPLISRIQSSQ